MGVSGPTSGPPATQETNPCARRPTRSGPPTPAGIRAAWDRLCGRPEPDPPPATPARPELTADELEAYERLDGQHDRRRGMPMCERCGSRRGEDDSTLHRRWCESCDQQWIEEEVCTPLVARMGRRKARQLLKACVKGELRLSDRKVAL